MVCMIFGAGEYPQELSLPISPEAAYVIAADGGMDACHKLGITPNLTIGDFDSVHTVPTGAGVIRLPVEKNVTDMAAAVEEGRRHGCDSFLLFGGTGGRPDHTMANYQLLHAIAQRGETAFLVGVTYSATAIIEGTTLTFSEAGGTLSVFAIGGQAKGVYECGMQYPLANATLIPTVPLGVSNRILEKNACVSVEQGALLVLWEGQQLPEKSTAKT